MTMKKVVAFVGAARKGYTYEATRVFLDRLEALGGVQTELVRLGDYHLEPCRGCKACFSKGEEFCPLKDDRDVLLAKMKEADGVVFASPNYSFQVSALTKLFLDRLGYGCHRPQCHGKAFTSIVVQGFFGGDKILKYFGLMGAALGFDVVKGSCHTALVPMADKEREKRDEALGRQAQRFRVQLGSETPHVPNLLEVVLFRLGRNSVRIELDEKEADYRFYAERGWFNSPYFYPTRLGPVKRTVGRLADVYFARSIASKKAARRVHHQGAVPKA
ncbi:MAG TPA: flavodoxin family protein [Vicinamibacterales bacterium]|nr:flavodoxin family protein [Vicinamibacterales bacterium]